MKWEANLTKEEEEFDRRKELEKWHRVFAFLPVRTREGNWVWLQLVWRRNIRFTPLSALRNVLKEPAMYLWEYAEKRYD